MLDNKLIAKNTILLYIRTFIILIISIYTSRVVLLTLGEEDYGIYSVVGGVIGMLSFLNASLGGATTRFMCYALGTEDENNLKTTFSSALMLHIGIALILLVLGETVGLWFVNTRLAIPSDRMTAANVVYQCSILSSVVTVTQSPYNASLTAHEKYDIYAYLDILSAVLKLLAVLLLTLIAFDGLILYAVLILSISIVIASLNRIYCIRHYVESHFSLILDKDLLKQMVGFSGWNLVGTMSESVNTQGTNMIYNIIFGPIINAAMGLATTVQGAIMSFSYNIITAFRSQIVQQYAKNDIQVMLKLLNNASKYSTALFLLITIPFISEADFILKIWLKDVPDLTSQFMRIMLVASLFWMNFQLVSFAIGATGRIRAVNILKAVFILTELPIIYLMLRKGISPTTAYMLCVPVNLSILVCSLFILKKYIRDIKLSYLLRCHLPNLFAIIVAGSAIYYLHFHLESGLIRLSIVILLTILSLAVVHYLMLGKDDRQSLLNILKCKIL